MQPKLEKAARSAAPDRALFVLIASMKQRIKILSNERGEWSRKANEAFDEYRDARKFEQALAEQIANCRYALEQLEIELADTLTTEG